MLTALLDGHFDAAFPKRRLSRHLNVDLLESLAFRHRKQRRRAPPTHTFTPASSKGSGNVSATTTPSTCKPVQKTAAIEPLVGMPASKLAAEVTTIFEICAKVADVARRTTAANRMRTVHGATSSMATVFTATTVAGGHGWANGSRLRGSGGDRSDSLIGNVRDGEAAPPASSASANTWLLTVSVNSLSGGARSEYSYNSRPTG